MEMAVKQACSVTTEAQASLAKKINASSSFSVSWLSFGVVMNALTKKMKCWNANQCSDSYRWYQLLPVEPVLLWAQDFWFVATGKWKRGLPAGLVTCPLLFFDQNCNEVWISPPFFSFGDGSWEHRTSKRRNIAHVNCRVLLIAKHIPENFE